MAKRGQPGFNAGALLHLHNRLEEKFSEILGFSVVIHDKNDTGWEKSPPDPERPFFFSLAAGQGTTEADVTNHSGSQRVVFPLGASDANGDVGWVSWREAWVKFESGKLCLLKSGGFSFYWGRAGRTESKMEVLRAEWDQIPPTEGEAGQPHWHIDKRFVIGNRSRVALVPAEAQPIDLEAIEPTKIAMREIDPKDAHLGMAGWRNECAGLTHWQVRAGEWRELAQWAERTLVYVKKEFARIRPARPVQPEDLEN